MNHEAIDIYNEVMKCKSKIYNIKELAYNLYLLKCGFRKIHLVFPARRYKDLDTNDLDEIFDRHNILRIYSSKFMDNSIIFTMSINNVSKYINQDGKFYGNYFIIGKLLGYDNISIRNFHKESDIPSFNYTVYINNVYIYNFVCNNVKNQTNIVKRLQLKVNEVKKLLMRDGILNKNSRRSIVKFKVEPFGYDRPQLQRKCKKMKRV